MLLLDDRPGGANYGIVSGDCRMVSRMIATLLSELMSIALFPSCDVVALHVHDQSSSIVS